MKNIHNSRLPKNWVFILLQASTYRRKLCPKARKTSIVEKKTWQQKVSTFAKKPMVYWKRKHEFFFLISLLNSKPLMIKKCFSKQHINLLKHSLWKCACLFEELSKGFHNDSVIHHYITKHFPIHQVISLHFERIHWLQWIGPTGDVVNSPI